MKTARIECAPVYGTRSYSVRAFYRGRRVTLPADVISYVWDYPLPNAPGMLRLYAALRAQGFTHYTYWTRDHGQDYQLAARGSLTSKEAR